MLTDKKLALYAIEKPHSPIENHHASIEKPRSSIENHHASIEKKQTHLAQTRSWRCKQYILNAFAATFAANSGLSMARSTFDFSFALDSLLPVWTHLR